VLSGYIYSGSAIADFVSSYQARAFNPGSAHVRNSRNKRNKPHLSLSAAWGPRGLNTSRVAGLSLRCSRRSRIAPCSTLDSLFLTRITPRLALIDRCCPPIARRSTLSAPRRSQIAPRSTLCARAGHGLLRAQHFEPLPRLRIAPYSTLSFPRRPRIAPRSTLPTPRRSRIAPCSTIDAQCRSTDISVRLHSAPCAVHGSLRAQHFKLRTVHRLLCVRHLHFVRFADHSALLTPCLVLLANCSVLNT
jgi:hypothetical protein